MTTKSPAITDYQRNQEAKKPAARLLQIPWVSGNVGNRNDENCPTCGVPLGDQNASGRAT